MGMKGMPGNEWDSNEVDPWKNELKNERVATNEWKKTTVRHRWIEWNKDEVIAEWNKKCFIHSR